MTPFIGFRVDTSCSSFLQVDWYCCNVGSYHALRAIDPSIGVADDEDVKRWVVDEDAVVAGAVAKAVGADGLDALVEHFTSKSELLSAAKLQWAMANAGPFLDEERMKAALTLIDDNGVDMNAPFGYNRADELGKELLKLPMVSAVTTATSEEGQGSSLTVTFGDNDGDLHL